MSVSSCIKASKLGTSYFELYKGKGSEKIFHPILGKFRQKFN